MRGLAQATLYSILGCAAVVNNTAGGAFIRDNVGGRGGWRCKPVETTEIVM
jgi:hypothetical protein